MKALILSLLLISTDLIAQNDWVLPASKSHGDYQTVRFLVYKEGTPKSDQLFPVPPLAWDTVRLKVQEATKKWTIEPAVFDSIIIKIEVDKTTRMAIIPDIYCLIKDKVMIKTPSVRWKERHIFDGCYMDEQKITDYSRWKLVEIPGEYKTVQKRTIKATTHQIRVDSADTIFIKQIIEIKPLQRIEIDIPIQYQTIFIKKTPNTYWTKWEEVLCASCVLREGPGVRDIQKKLTQLGYDVGKIDDILGKKTKKALFQFQKDFQLPSGRLNIETLKALGIFDNE
jgi:hypothetical protein